MTKGFVRGYFEKRNGRLVWISPYENSKDKHKRDGASTVKENPESGGPKLPRFDPSTPRHSAKPVVIPAKQPPEKFNFLLEVIVRCVKTIDAFEPGEIVKLRHALKIAKSIIAELGYMDRGLVAAFDPPNAPQTKLGRKASRVTAAIAKELNRLSRRVSKATLREKVQRMATALDEAL